MDFWQRVLKKIDDERTTQAWVASKIGMRPDSFSRWISRDVWPGVDMGVGIAKALGTTAEYLVTGESAAEWKPTARIASIVGCLMELDDHDLRAVATLAHGLAEQHLEPVDGYQQSWVAAPAPAYGTGSMRERPGLPREDDKKKHA